MKKQVEQADVFFCNPSGQWTADMKGGEFSWPHPSFNISQDYLNDLGANIILPITDAWKKHHGERTGRKLRPPHSVYFETTQNISEGYILARLLYTFSSPAFGKYRGTLGNKLAEVMDIVIKYLSSSNCLYLFNAHFSLSRATPCVSLATYTMKLDGHIYTMHTCLKCVHGARFDKMHFLLDDTIGEGLPDIPPHSFPISINLLQFRTISERRIQPNTRIKIPANISSQIVEEVLKRL